MTSVVVALATTITTQSFAQDRGTGATPAAGAKAGAIQGTFTTSEAIPWKPVDPKHPGLMMFVLWGNPNEGASEILQKFPAGMDSGWHWHTAAYEGVVIQFTHFTELPDLWSWMLSTGLASRTRRVKRTNNIAVSSW